MSPISIAEHERGVCTELWEGWGIDGVPVGFTPYLSLAAPRLPWSYEAALIADGQVYMGAQRDMGIPTPEARGLTPGAWEIFARCRPSVVHCANLWDSAPSEG